MAITRVEIKDFLVFKGEFSADFAPGVNVLLGGNGTGKTTLLRNTYESRRRSIGLESEGVITESFTEGFVVYPQSAGLVSAVYIPEYNVLAHAKGLLETVKFGKLNYELSEVEIIEKARVLPMREKQPLVKVIENIVGGSACLSDDGQTFVINRNELAYPIQLLQEASGYQKFALLALLIRNEQINPETVLFWDEPENSLNPELVPKLVDILLELAKSGVQIFIATHDYNVARYFDIRKGKVPVLFHNLSKTEDGQIKCDSSPEYLKVPNNLLEKASEELFNAVVDTAMEVREDE